MKKATATAPRRSQGERRAITITKLIDATIETIMEVGYARTTVKEVCARAELSHGALFRFFPTMLDLIMAAAEEIADRQTASFERKWDAHKDKPEPLYESLLLLRESCRSPTNQVFYELLVAARTDAELRRVLRPGIERFFGIIRASAQRMQALAALPPEIFDTLLFSAMHLFDGESLVRKIYAQPEQEAHRMALLRTLVATIASAR